MVEQFETYRTHLFSIAYRMLGSAMDAEDIVQEAYLHAQSTPTESIKSYNSWFAHFERQFARMESECGIQS
jgi:RNA polymerase sigma-70 factor (ECF subfamily)